MKPEDETTDLLIALKEALEWMGRKPKGRNERMSFMFAQGFVRNGIAHLESKKKVEEEVPVYRGNNFLPTLPV